MRPGWAIASYFGLVAVGAAVISPLIYSAVQSAAPHWPYLKSWANYPFSRYLQRCLLGLALVGIWPFLRATGRNSWPLLGFRRPKLFFRQLGAGFAAGFASLALVLAFGLLFHARQLDMDHSPRALAGHFAAFTLTALIVSLIEEIFFRGAVFGSLRQSLSWPAAAWISSLFYAAVHFFAQTGNSAPVRWSSGFAVLAGMVRSGFVFDRMIPGFLTLTCAGLILALAYQRLGSLAFPIGLHAGWIFWLKFYGYLTEKAPNGGAQFWGTGKLIDGWFAFVILALMLAGAWALANWQTRSPPAVPLQLN